MAGMAGLEPANAGVKVPCLTTWLHPSVAGKSSGPERTLRPFRLEFYGVGDGTRTRDTRNHNPMLYQLNYTHHIGTEGTGTPEVWPISGLAGGKFAGQSPFRRRQAERRSLIRVRSACCQQRWNFIQRQNPE